MADKVDLKKELGTYRARRGQFEIVEVPDHAYLMVDGHGDPNTSPRYAEAVEALFSLAYTLKFASKRDLGRDYVVMPLEGLWWADDMAAFTADRDKSQWDWTMMILTPDWIDEAMFDQAVAQVAAKGDRPLLHEVRLEVLSEGCALQTLHVGPFDEEGPVLERMHHEIIPARGLRMVGKHHEIYLSDPRRIEPAKLRTILRQPVRSAGTAP